VLVADEIRELELDLLLRLRAGGESERERGGERAYQLEPHLLPPPVVLAPGL
jgi:hypothetical protein